MHFAEPLQELMPGATGRVLAVVVDTSRPLSGRAIARLAGVSTAQGARVLRRLTEMGVVEAHEAPPAILYALAEDHVVAAPLRDLAHPTVAFVNRLAGVVATLAARRKRWDPGRSRRADVELRSL